MKYLQLGIVDIHNHILAGDVTPLELVQEALSSAKNDDNNAFEYICEKEALADVKKLDPKKKNNLLYGIPVVIKDNFSTKDIPTTESSDMLNGYIPVYSAEVINRLENEGAIVIAKSTMDELAMGGKGTNGHLGITYNPWDKEKKRIVGGSSSGSAVSVAAGIVPFALGSDTGDSVRKPASYNGLVGFKPSWGRISRFGLLPFSSSLDHVAYFTRNIQDAAIVLNVLAGRDDKDMTSSFKPVEDYCAHLNEPIKGKKIAVIKGVIDSASDQRVVDIFNKNIEELRKLGAIIETVEIDTKILKSIYPTYIIISSAESTSNNACLDGIKFGPKAEGNTYEEIVFNSRTKGFSASAKKRFIIGGYSLLKENRDSLFVRAQKCRHLIVDTFNNILSRYEAIYCPAAPSIAPLINEKPDVLSDQYLISENYLAVANMGGLPSITIPLGIIDGFPIGGNLTSKAFDESNLLSIASGVEKTTNLKDLYVQKVK